MALIKKLGAEAAGFNTCRGIIGALAAIGETLEGDYTYELIAYRTPENLGTKRRVDEASIFEMDKLTLPYTFNNVDSEKNRVIITPRGPDPILFGIRGESAEIVKKAFEIVKPLEPVERWVIFRSNQGTDAHLKAIKALSDLNHTALLSLKVLFPKIQGLFPCATSSSPLRMIRLKWIVLLTNPRATCEKSQENYLSVTALKFTVPCTKQLQLNH